MTYLGGKWRLSQWVISHFPDHRLYLEPFGGGGSVLMRKPRAYIEVYNDLDEEVVGVFQVLRDPEQAEQLRQRLDLTLYAAAEIAGCYDPTPDPVERARRVIVRSYFLFSHDSVFEPDSTFIRSKTKLVATSWDRYLQAFHTYHQRLKGVTIENLDAMQAIRFYDSEDTLHYVDPPYVASTRAKSVYRHEMSDERHRELAEVLHSVKGFVVLSGYNCPLYEALYADWKRVVKPSQNFIHQSTEESLWLSTRVHPS